ncbi:ECF-family sigma factor W [Corynebacterium resistens DSM 45100]|uniref:ECF-family sigma factor W n=1 Tax=Corynebacterium resistens (strain DSM 45100 / JCM 12819 / GTC 2026 / SICGH 158) TaxID=662755 RepID=F8DXW2_CORRG|nr:sigma-70 family RNA polymerase sigma factor [Corynebacterium resistens]AEI08759.1 ECF-family sigma factor W [Corynebacterium resistens DSM 45100]
MDEKALLEAARSGDQRAFASLCEDCRVRAWNVCLRICGNYHDAEDALQSALALAWKNLEKFRGSSTFSTWFYRIASNASLELVRSRKATVSVDDDSFGHEIQLEDFSAQFESSVVENDRVSQALKKIPEKSQEALVLWSVAGLKIQEIAVHQKSSVSATKVRLHRAKKELREILSEMP